MLAWKTLQQQSISEPVFYGDLIYKFKIIVGNPFPDQFKWTIYHWGDYKIDYISGFTQDKAL